MDKIIRQDYSPMSLVVTAQKAMSGIMNKNEFFMGKMAYVDHCDSFMQRRCAADDFPDLYSHQTSG